jgi:hypothetical protein
VGNVDGVLETDHQHLHAEVFPLCSLLFSHFSVRNAPCSSVLSLLDGPPGRLMRNDRDVQHCWTNEYAFASYKRFKVLYKFTGLDSVVCNQVESRLGYLYLASLTPFIGRGVHELCETNGFAFAAPW